MWEKSTGSITNNSTLCIPLISFLLLFSIFGELEYSPLAIDQNLQILINMTNLLHNLVQRPWWRENR